MTQYDAALWCPCNGRLSYGTLSQAIWVSSTLSDNRPFPQVNLCSSAAVALKARFEPASARSDSYLVCFACHWLLSEPGWVRHFSFWASLIGQFSLSAVFLFAPEDLLCGFKRPASQAPCSSETFMRAALVVIILESSAYAEWRFSFRECSIQRFNCFARGFIPPTEPVWLPIVWSLL